MARPNFKISSPGTVSAAFRNAGASTFIDACKYITRLPYVRNEDKNHPLSVFADGCGTCSTKHALLANMAKENGIDDIKLMMGIYKMSSSNTPPVANVLKLHGLEYLPEAHNYLRYHEETIDCTASKPLNFLPYLLEEIEISPDQITDFKIAYHKRYLDRWRETSCLNYTLEELWVIREACIAALAGI